MVPSLATTSKRPVGTALRLRQPSLLARVAQGSRPPCSRHLCLLLGRRSTTAAERPLVVCLYLRASALTHHRQQPTSPSTSLLCPRAQRPNTRTQTAWSLAPPLPPSHTNVVSLMPSSNGEEEHGILAPMPATPVVLRQVVWLTTRLLMTLRLLQALSQQQARLPDFLVSRALIMFLLLLLQHAMSPAQCKSIPAVALPLCRVQLRFPLQFLETEEVQVGSTISTIT